MKFNHLGQKVFAGAVSALLAFGTSSCSRDYVAAFVYTVSASNGNISGFAVDYQSGALVQVPGSPFASNFTNPTTIVASPGGKYIYVVGGTQNAQVEEYAVGTDGKIYGEHTYTLTGSYPTSATIDSNGKFLYVTYTYQQGFTPASPGPGGVTIFPISATDGSLGTALNANAGTAPVGIAVSSPVTANGNAVYAYVLNATDTSIIAYQSNTTTGALTQVASTTAQPNPVHVGVSPSAIAIEPTARFVYVADKNQNEVIGFQLTGNGSLIPMVGSPFAVSGLLPVGLTIEPRGKYLYTANFNSTTISGFAINASNGNLSGAIGSGSFPAGPGTTCVVVEPALGIYLYASNYTDGTITGAKLSPNTGQLTPIVNTPFTAQALPSCITAIANGQHNSQLVFPN